jgi:hypothetical protein
MENETCITLPAAAVDALTRLATDPELATRDFSAPPNLWPWVLGTAIVALIAVEAAKLAFILWRDYL